MKGTDTKTIGLIQQHSSLLRLAMFFFCCDRNLIRMDLGVDLIWHRLHLSNDQLVPLIVHVVVTVCTGFYYPYEDDNKTLEVQPTINKKSPQFLMI